METKAHAVAKVILAEARHEVERADTKASTLLTAAGVVASVTVGAMLAGDWSPDQLACSSRVIWWIGAASGAAGIGAVGLAVFPRIGNTVADRPALAYFNDVALLGSVEAVKDTLGRIEPEERDVNQMIALSSIARRKYIWIRRAMVLLALGVALMIGAGITGR